jgi:hypothetical protein
MVIAALVTVFATTVTSSSIASAVGAPGRTDPEAEPVPKAEVRPSTEVVSKIEIVPMGKFIEYALSTGKTRDSASIEIKGLLRDTGAINTLEEAAYNGQKALITAWRLDGRVLKNVPGQGRRTIGAILIGEARAALTIGQPAFFKADTVEYALNAERSFREAETQAQAVFLKKEDEIRALDINELEKHMTNKFVNLRKVTFQKPTSDERIFFWDAQNSLAGIFISEALIYDGEVMRRYLRVYSIWDMKVKRIVKLIVTIYGERLE